MVTRRSEEGVRGETKVVNRAPLDQQSSGICVSCNNTWLKEIDQAAEARTINLAYKSTREIPAVEVVAVATAAARAGLIKIWSDRASFGYPAAALLQFGERRIPPDAVYIFMGYSEDAFLYAGGHHSATSTTEPPDRGVHIVAWSLGWLFVVVVAPASENTSLAGSTARRVREVSKAFGGVLQQVWPRERGDDVVLPNRTLSREMALFLTQAKPLLAGSQPVIMEDEPDRLRKRLEIPQADLQKLIRYPTKVPPPLPGE
jgi:hypothetical protein